MLFRLIYVSVIEFYAVTGAHNVKISPFDCVNIVCSSKRSFTLHKLLTTGMRYMLFIYMLAGKQEANSDRVLIWLACDVVLF